MLNKVLKAILVLVLISAAYFVYLGISNKEDTVLTTVEIDAPAEMVYQYVTNETLSKSWLPGLESIERVGEGELEVGAKYNLVFKEGKRTFEMMETITAVEPNQRFAFKLEDKMMTGHVDVSLEADGDRTTVTETHTFSARSFSGRAMMGLMKGAIKKGKKDMYNDLKTAVESNSGDYVPDEPEPEVVDSTDVSDAAEEAIEVVEEAAAEASAAGAE